MNHKKSMRIFWLSLSLLLVSGTVIISVAQYRSHQKEMKNLAEEKNQNQTQMGESQTDTDLDQKQKANEDMDTESSTHTGVSQNSDMRTQQEERAQGRQESQAQPTSGGTAQYRFELKVKNGYVDVYHYHTENLFFHTGIPYHVLTLEQRQELQNGKYFLSEQELYGYLESCTS